MIRYSLLLLATTLSGCVAVPAYDGAYGTYGAYDAYGAPVYSGPVTTYGVPVAPVYAGPPVYYVGPPVRFNFGFNYWSGGGHRHGWGHGGGRFRR